MFRARDGTRAPELPPELARLDSQLREIAIRERCSFGAELRATLEEERRKTTRRMGSSEPSRRWSGPRMTVVAVAGVLFLSAALLAAPSARASLVKLLGGARLSESGGAQVESQLRFPTSSEARDGAEEAQDEVEEAGEASALPPKPDEIPPPDVPTGLPATLPGILDPADARRAVAARYPSALQEAGIGGTVRVLAWVEADGTADHLQVGESSGVAALDRAALGAAGAFRFRPAMRGLRPVGTWVEFEIRFRPSARAGDQPEPEYQAPRIPLSY